MALNRTEIELLIKARNDAQGAFDQLNKQVKSVTGETDKASEGMDRLGKKTRDGGVAATGAGVAFGLLAERIGRGLVTAFGDTIREANALDRGLIGLGATAKAFNTDANAAQQAAKDLAADGLMNVGEAASGLKNLLAGGFNLPQAIELMNRFKDSAAFGRQGSLEFGQAIVGATEGIKNGNSALVDNAGLTKNLSNILVEAGFSAQDLSKVQSDLNVRTALYNGILKETAPQLGQTALFLDTAQGKQAQFNSQVTIAQQKIGAGLQPVLGKMQETLAPMVKFVGDNAGAFISLGAAVATVVGPLAAMKAASALGIPSLADMANKALGLGQQLATATSAAGTFRGGLAQVATQSGFTVKDLGLLKTAGLLAGAAFVGWEFGKAIAQLTGLDKAIERTVDRMTGLTGQEAGARQDVIDRAIASGADRWIKYSEAIKFNSDVLVANQKVSDDNIAGLRRQADAKLAIGKIDAAQHNDLMILLAAREREARFSENQIKLKEQLAGAEKKYRDEIAQTGQTHGQLLKALDQNEAAFEKWAETVGLSDQSVKRLKADLQEQEKQHDKNTAAAKKAADAEKELTKELEDQAGVLTTKGLNEQLDRYQKLLNLAATQGTPALKTAVQNLWPELQKLYDQAKASGLAVDNLRGIMQQAAEGAGLVLQNVRNFNQVIPLMTGVTEANRVNTAEVRLAVKAQEDLQNAYRNFGLRTPEELRKVADESRRNYQLLRESGMATTSQLKTAYQQMIDDQRAATGQLPSFWEKNVFPAIKGTVETIGQAVQGSFAQMLLGAKSFGDGFKDIWESLKAGVMKILTELLSSFVNTFLKGILGAMSGQRGALGNAFSGLFSGGGPGGGLGSLLGIGGGPGGGFVGPLLPGTGGAAAGTGAGAGGGGLFGGLSAAGIGGGLLAGGAGIGLGLLGKNIFGGAGLRAGGFGAGTGFASGALIGSVVPGIGTLVGGIVGGLAGLLSGLFGKKESQKVGEARDQFIGKFGGAGTGEGSGFLTLAGELAKLSTAAGGGEGGGALFRNLINAKTVKEFEDAIRAVQRAMEGTEYATIKVNEATDQLTRQRQQAVAAGQTEDDVIRAQADSYNQLLAVIQKQGVEAPEALRPVLERLLEMGLLVDENGVKVTDLEAIFDRSTREIENAVQGAADETRQLGQVTEDVARGVDRSLAGMGRDFDGAANAAEGAARDIESAFDGLAFTIPVEYDVAAPPGEGGGGEAGVGGGDELPGAAKGVMADRASLVIFGEGGEPEVGGPRSFFKDIFRQLAKEGVAIGGGGGQGGLTVIMNISALGPADVATTIEKTVMPKLNEIWRQNRGGALTNTKQILGVD